MKPTNIKRLLRRTTLWGAMNALDQEKFIKKLTEQVIKLEERVKELEKGQAVKSDDRIWSAEDLARDLYEEKED